MRKHVAALIAAFVLATTSTFSALSIAASRPAAGTDTCAAPAGLVTPIGVTSCSGVRPGSAVQTNVGGCTLNFLFLGSDGNRYIGTAGHCFLADDANDTVYGGAGGPIAKVDGAPIGRAAYAVLNDDRDIALIRLNPGVEASAAVPFFGGPTGIYTDHSSTPVVMHHYGHGLLLGDTVPARTAVAPATTLPNRVYMVGAGVFGDSGSGVISDDGRAVGVLVTLGIHAAPGNAGTNGVTRLDYQLPFIQAALGITLTLQTAPLT
jgi:hypothetical protein